MNTSPPSFDTGGFLRYLAYLFPTVFDASYFGRQLGYNLVSYAEAYKNHGKDEMCDFLSELLPDVSFGEIAAFAPDGVLTPSYGQAEKRRAVARYPIIRKFQEQEGSLFNS